MNLAEALPNGRMSSDDNHDCTSTKARRAREPNKECPLRIDRTKRDTVLPGAAIWAGLEALA